MARYYTRRRFIKKVGMGTVGLALGPGCCGAGPSSARPSSSCNGATSSPATTPGSTSTARAWGNKHNVEVIVDHISLSDLKSTFAAEVVAGKGHDLVEFIAPPSDFEPSVLDLTDVNQEAVKRFGAQVPVATESSYNPLHQEVLRLLPRLDHRPGGLPQVALGKGRQTGRAAHLGRPARPRGAHPEGTGGPGRHRPLPGTRLEHGRPGAALVLRQQHPGRPRERGARQPEDHRGGQVHGRLLQAGPHPRGLQLEPGLQQPAAASPARPPTSSTPSPPTARRRKSVPGDRQGRLLHARR